MSEAPPEQRTRLGALEASVGHGIAGRSLAAWALLLTVVAIGLVGDLISKSWAFKNVAGKPVTLVYEEVVGNPRYPLPFHEGVRRFPLTFWTSGWSSTMRGVRRRPEPPADLHRLHHHRRDGGGRVLRPLDEGECAVADIAIGMILAGGLGNLYDRLTVGAVRDLPAHAAAMGPAMGMEVVEQSTNEVLPVDL